MHASKIILAVEIHPSLRPHSPQSLFRLEIRMCVFVGLHSTYFRLRAYRHLSAQAYNIHYLKRSSSWLRTGEVLKADLVEDLEIDV
jgi:hypothetical protein